MSAHPARGTDPGEARAVMRAFLSADEERAWRALVQAYESLMRALDACLLTQHRLPLTTFEALIEIAHADVGSISVSELAQRIRLSASRTSRLAMELEAQGLAERQRDSADTRSTRIAATRAGRERLLEAAPTYLSAIRAQLFEGLGASDVTRLAGILNRMQGTA